MRLTITALLLGAAWAARPPALQAKSLSLEIGELLRSRIEAAGAVPMITVGEEIIHASVTLPIFYERRSYHQAWSDDRGPLPQVQSLVQAIRGADQEGLRPSDYHLSRIETTLAEVLENQKRRRPLNPGRLVDLDLLLTDGFLIYASHLLAGRINPETIDPEWYANRREADLAAVLQRALDSDSIAESLRGLLPPQPGYARLRQTLARYRELDGWTAVPEDLRMEKGERGERVTALRKRLAASGDIDTVSSAEVEFFDDALEQAVRRFQKRNGLQVDGVVGASTLAALNVPAEQRQRQIQVNMERWRWLPQELGKRHLLVNIANFELDVVEEGRVVLVMRTVVGREYRRTPVFSAKMTYLVFNPYWHVPPGIAVQDILPAVRKNPDYLPQKEIKVFQGWGAETKEIDPDSVNWSSVTARNSAYRFRQEPGPNNALGRVKFMFPNKFNVYLHDTPSRELFAKTERAFSSGCIRIEKPIELAEYVLGSDPEWTRESILAHIQKDRDRTVPLPEPIAVHLLYWTTWVEEDGTVQFRNDVYGRDRLLKEALEEVPPSVQGPNSQGAG